MSISYWIIDGVGIDVSKLEQFLNKEKLVKLLSEQIPDDETLIEIIISKEYDKLDVDDYLYGQPFNDLADLFTYCDETDTITYGNDGDGGAYFYYPPSMPWHRTDSEPDTLDEVHKRIIKAVQVITDLTDEEIEQMIDDDLYVVGIG